MSSVNIVFLIGNLGRDPEIKYTQNNVPVANFSMATTESWKDKATGEWQEKTEWHKIVAWRHLAERAEKYLKKGMQVYVKGKNETRKWTGKDGHDNYTTEVIAQEMFTTGRKEERGKPAGVDESGHFSPPEIDNSKEAEDDSLPF